MNYYKLNFSCVTKADERYLFPKNWNLSDMKQALNSASISNGNYTAVLTVHNILNPRNNEQEISVKMTVAEKTKKIITFFPVRTQAFALSQKAVQLPDFDPPAWQKFYPCSINGTQFVFHPLIYFNPYSQAS